MPEFLLTKLNEDSFQLCLSKTSANQLTGSPKLGRIMTILNRVMFG